MSKGRYTTSSGQEAMTPQEWRDRGGYQHDEGTNYVMDHTPRYACLRKKIMKELHLDEAQADAAMRSACIQYNTFTPDQNMVLEVARGMYSQPVTRDSHHMLNNASENGLRDQPTLTGHTPAMLPAGTQQVEPTGGILAAIVGMFVKSNR